MKHPSSILLAGIVCALARAAAADPPPSDLALNEPPAVDLVPAFYPLLTEPSSGHATVSLAFSMLATEDKRDFAGSLAFEFPFERIGTSGAKSGVEKPDPDDESPADPPPRAKRKSRHMASASPRTDGSLPIIRPRDARAAIDAAERHRNAAATFEELDDLGTRARVSTLLPQLRLRVTRLIDENQSLSPTSYDADRTTASGGASLWLEARATWTLDRLVFASEEVRLAQLREEASKRVERRSREVLDVLFAWQRAAYAMHDPALDTMKCVETWLTEEQLAAALDLETGGWFSRWRQKKHIREPSCVAQFNAQAAESPEGEEVDVDE